MKALPEELSELLKVTKAKLGDQLEKVGESFDHKRVADLSDRVRDEVGTIIADAIKEMEQIPMMPANAKRSSFLNIASSAATAAIGIVAMGSMAPDVLKNTHGPDEVTRDQMLFAALFVIANEVQTDEGKRAVVEMAAKFAAGDQRSVPGAMAHHWFDMIRGYRFRSSKLCEG